MTMTVPMLAWLMSILGAGLFFAAGTLFAMRRFERVDVPQRSFDERSSGIQLTGKSASSDRARRHVAALVEELKVRGSSDPSSGTGNALRAILHEETRDSNFAGAVIADDMGLVVASTGEYGDALAAYGAFLAGIGAKTSDALPLHDLRQVIVQDEHDMTLTVRPIATADDNFALVTLATGHHNVPLRTGTSSER
jgi:predicted regulator of Ras-like GTPase activity (Roadblock/LC7/MglB family)